MSNRKSVFFSILRNITVKERKDEFRPSFEFVLDVKSMTLNIRLLSKYKAPLFCFGKLRQRFIKRIFNSKLLQSPILFLRSRLSVCLHLFLCHLSLTRFSISLILNFGL